MPALDAASWLNAASRTWRCQLNSRHRCSTRPCGLCDANLGRGIAAQRGFLATQRCLLLTRHRGTMRHRRLHDANLTRGIAAQRGFLAARRCLLMTRHRGSMRHRGLHDANLTRGIVAQRGFLKPDDACSLRGIVASCGIADLAMPTQLVASLLNASSRTSRCQLNSWHRGSTRIPRGQMMPALDAACGSMRHRGLHDANLTRGIADQRGSSLFKSSFFKSSLFK